MAVKSSLLSGSLALMLSMTLASCASMSGPTSAELDAQDVATCSGYGFKIGTDKFAECRMQLDGERRAGDQAMAAAMLSRPQLPTYSPYLVPMPRRPVNCTSMPIGNMVNTSCY